MQKQKTQTLSWNISPPNNPKNLILGHLNINSLINKFERMKNIIEDTFDIFLI